MHGPALGTRDTLAWLLGRITFGFTLEEHALAESMGYSNYLEYQLDHLAIDDSAVEASVAKFPSLTMTSKQIHDVYGYGGTLPPYELQWATTLRAISSKRQLFERMVEFWSDHFNIDQDLHPLRNLKTADDRDVIRPHALGKFPDLLRASAHSGAMLVYLDNVTNTKDAPQENYARELMELHTLGVTGPYTETDVKNVARALTGWGIHNSANPDYGEFRYLNHQHDQDAKVVLGTPIPPNGAQSDGDQVLDLLALHPATADFIGRKLIRRFLCAEPPQGLVDDVRDTYLQTGGDIKAMLRVILGEANLPLVDPWSNPRYRRPFHLFTAVMRAFKIDFPEFIDLYHELVAVGQVPFGWPGPDGYPDTIEAWGGNVLASWTFVSRLLDSKIEGVRGSQQVILGLLASTNVTPLAWQINVALSGGAIGREETNRVQAFVDSFPTVDWKVVREAIALMVTSRSFQFH